MNKVISAALLATVSLASAAIPATEICIANQGGYVLHWWVTDLLTGTNSNDSGNYPIDQTRCMDFSSIQGLSEHDLLYAQVHAVAGVTNNVDTAVFYQSTPRVVVTFTCGGTTLNFNCSLNGQAQETRETESFLQ